MQSKPDYISYKRAIAKLRERFDGVTPAELAAWVFMGKDDGGIFAYLNANEFDSPPRFFFSNQSIVRDYLPLLYQCWFKADDIAQFEPRERFITGRALLVRWVNQTEIPLTDRIRNATRESRLNPIHPTLGLTQATDPDDPLYAPLEEGLFSLTEVKAYEREEFGRELNEGADTAMQLDTDEAKKRAEVQAAYDETKLNGNAINWRYWVHQLPVISAAQAACLMSALEPDLFANLDECNWQDNEVRTDPARNIEKARKIQRLAEAQGKLTASPAEWVEWAQAQSPKINVHTGYLLAVWYPPDTAPAAKVEAGTGTTPVPAANDESVLTPSEQKIRAIEKFADELGYQRTAVPYRGKMMLMKKCKQEKPDLFGGGDDPFLDIWKVASKAGRIRIKNREKYLPRK